MYAPTTNAKEAEVEWFYEDLQDLLELTPKKDFLFIIGDWNAQVESQEREQVTLAAAAAKLLQSCPTLCDPVDGSPLQCSCLENPRDGGAWWAAVYGVAQSWTLLKRLSSSSRPYYPMKSTDATQSYPFHYRGLECTSRKSRERTGNSCCGCC